MHTVCHERNRNTACKTRMNKGESHRYHIKPRSPASRSSAAGANRCLRAASTSCARVRQTVPSVACGQMNRPRSRRLANRHSPSPSHHKSLTMSPLRPRKTKTCPENGCCSSTVCTFALRPSKPRRMSVTPAASHIFVPVRSSITCANSQGSIAAVTDQLRAPR